MSMSRGNIYRHQASRAGEVSKSITQLLKPKICWLKQNFKDVVIFVVKTLYSVLTEIGLLDKVIVSKKKFFASLMDMSNIRSNYIYSFNFTIMYIMYNLKGPSDKPVALMTT